jgi:hypothetical protein
MKSRSLYLLVPIVLLGGCRDLGLAGNVPEQESRRASPPELVAQVMAPAEADGLRLVVDGRLWAPQGQPSARPADQLRPVGATAGQTVYARAWDERPYRAIFTRVEMPPPDVATTARAAMEGRQDHWQEYAPVIGRRGRASPPARVLPLPVEEEPLPAEAELFPGETDRNGADDAPAAADEDRTGTGTEGQPNRSS